MNNTLVRLASALTRAWVHRYTLGLPPQWRDLRRAEVESDLWEHGQDVQNNAETGTNLGREILLRLVLGIPDDIGWRQEALRTLPMDSFNRRVAMMTISAGKMRWLAGCGLLAGAIVIGLRLLQLATGSEGSRPGAIILPIGLLALFGVLGLYAQHRDAGKISSVGFLLMFAGWASIVISTVAFVISPGSEFALWHVLINLGMLVMVPLGFLLLGIGLPGSSGYVPLFVGCYLIGQMLGATVIDMVFPPAAFLFSNEAWTIVMGLGLAAIGYVVWSGTKGATSELQTQPQ